MTSYIPRIADADLKLLLEGLAAVALEGPKGVGKTASASRLARTVYSLDRERVREALSANPGRLERASAPVLIDEWQHWPEVWDEVRHRVDEGAAPGSFILAGSAYPTGARVHSGAGRIITLRLRPLSLAERGLAEPTVSLGSMLSGPAPAVDGVAPVGLDEYVREILASGFPAIRALGPPWRGRQLRTYVESVVKREFRQQGLTVRQPQRLLSWLRAYAAATATNATYSTILDGATGEAGDKPAKDTTIAYRDALDSLWLLDPVPPWADGAAFYSRLSTGVKHYLADPALAATLLDFDEDLLLDGDAGTDLDERYGSITGRLFEGLIALSLHTYAAASGASLSYFRTRDGAREIDFIVQRGRRAVALEVKLSATVTDRDVRHLVWLRAAMGGRLADAAVITTGETAYRRADGIAVIPAALLGP